jgi:hypothetical protein
MRKTTPVFGRNRKPAYPCAIQLKSQTDLRLSIPMAIDSPCFSPRFATNSLLLRKKPFGDRFRWTASTASVTWRGGVP